MTTPTLCTIGDHDYVVDVEGIAWATVKPTRQGVDQGAGAGEASLSNEVVWLRVRDNWVGGAGQPHADLTDEDDPSSELRFATSSSIDCWTRRQLRLGRPLLSIREATGAGTFHRLYPAEASGGGGFWIVDDDTILAVTADPRDGTVATVGTAVTAAGTVEAATSFGDDILYYVTGGSIYTATRSGSTITLAAFGAQAADMLAACGSRLLGADGAELLELDGAGAPTTIYTHFLSGFRWGGAIPVANGIYAWGEVGGTGQLFLCGISDATGAIDAPIPVATLNVGETVTAVAAIGGALVIGTSVGVRLATINNDGTLTYGPAIDDLGAIRDLVAAGEYVYAAADVDPYVYRIDPSRFTSGALVPAFAGESDHVASTLTAGLSSEARHLAAAVVDADGTDPAQPVVAVISDDVALFYADNDGSKDLVAPSGEIDLGWFSFGIGEELSLDSVTVELDPVTDGSGFTVAVFVDTPDTDAVLEGHTDFSDGGAELTVHADEDLRARRFKVRLELTGDTTLGTSPVVRAVVLRAAPAPHLSDEMALPIILSDAVTTEFDAVRGLDPWAEWSYLHGLRDSRQRVRLRLGSFEATVRVEDVGVRSGGLGGGNGLDGWDERSQWMKGIWQVRLVTVEGEV